MIYLKLFLMFLKIGAFTFGGGYAMLPLIQEEVMKHNYMSADELMNFVAVSESTPGPFAVNISTYVGTKTAGLFGALCATTGVVLPSFIIILIVAKCYDRFRKSKVTEGVMSGLKPAVAALIAAAVISLSKGVFDFSGLLSAKNIVSAVIFLAAATAWIKKVHPVKIIIFTGIAGICAGYAQFL